MSDFASSLDQSLAQAWRPDQGGEDNPNPLIGTFVEMTSASTAYGACWVATVRLEDGSERAVWLMHTVLRNEMSKARPQSGERIGIKYHGKIDTKGGNDYVGYRVKVDRPLGSGEGIDWDRIGDAPESSPLDEPQAPAREPVTVPAGASKDDDDLPF